MCVPTKQITAVLQAGAERGWDGVREKCCLESSAPVTSFEHHHPCRASQCVQHAAKIS